MSADLGDDLAQGGAGAFRHAPGGRCGRPACGSRARVSTSTPMPPIQWVKLRQNMMPSGQRRQSGSVTVAPVVVKPDTASNSASLHSRGVQSAEHKGQRPEGSSAPPTPAPPPGSPPGRGRSRSRGLTCRSAWVQPHGQPAAGWTLPRAHGVPVPDRIRATSSAGAMARRLDQQNRAQQMAYQLICSFDG